MKKRKKKQYHVLNRYNVINVDSVQHVILFFFCFHSVHSASITGILSECSSGTAACLHRQVLLNCSAMLQLLLKCGYVHLRLVFYIFYCFRFYFLLMIDIVKSKTFKYFSILDRALLFLIEVNKTAVQSVPKILKQASNNSYFVFSDFKFIVCSE